jgi:GT2 family glycosyltransferase
MAHEPIVAVVVVHFGSAEMTKECVRSILSSSYRKVRLIVVDNFPEQRLSHLLPEIEASATYIVNPVNAGYCGGNNVGIRKAQEIGVEYILLLNNDTILDIDFLSTCITYMGRQPDIAVISPKILFYDSPEHICCAGGELNLNTAEINMVGLNEKDVGQFDTEREITFATGCAFFARTGLFDQVGLFDESLFCYGEDVDLSFRTLSAGHKMMYLPTALVWHKHPMEEHRERRRSGQFGAMSAMYYIWRNKYYNARKYTWRNRFLETIRFGYGFVLCLVAYALKYKRFDLSLAMLFGLFDGIAGRMGRQGYWFLNAPRNWNERIAKQ